MSYTLKELEDLIELAKAEKRELAHLDHHGEFWPPIVIRLAEQLHAEALYVIEAVAEGIKEGSIHLRKPPGPRTR